MNSDNKRIDSANTSEELEAIIKTLQVGGIEWDWAHRRLASLRHLEATTPHWTIVPNFRATVTAAVASILACIIALLGWIFPRSPAAPNTAPTPQPTASVSQTSPSTQSTVTQLTTPQSPTPSPNAAATSLRQQSLVASTPKTPAQHQ